MKQFTDAYGNRVMLVLGIEPVFTQTPGHVLILTRFKQEWVLTNHRERGYEFPGGKVEVGEEAEEAAIREVWEETGGIANHLVFIGQYQVTSISGKTFWKTIFAAELIELKNRESYEETNGPVLMQELPVAITADDRFSFIMKDDVVPRAISFAIKQGLFK
ncbi:RNA deprotection pyrophosphohydrolase [Shouchella patagoniensis]|uniref:RNA deprotection pyrophosphohydrolase n=1 Tax=Shouchella patagoniensis TaxID=228576 RepID=UPI0009951210|nr:nucleoside triphosphatase YtkD [Shouchella patagoniensis]